ncbi:MAG TPA: V-type ATP synthase subunit E family protein [Patescibacteria group bacterium]|nr:V-type ATP synthase subunit E family protein [Patescibacteria group bacterium]
MEESESTEAIRKRIISEAEKIGQEVVEEAKSKAAEILNEAGKRADEMKKSELEQIKKQMKNRSMQDLAEKTVAYHRRVQSQKSQIIDEAFEKAREKTLQYVKKTEYLETLKDLIVESAVGLGGGKLYVSVNQADRKKATDDLMKKLSKVVQKKTGNETELILDNDSLKAVGGAVVSTFDRQASIDNTFEARLERVIENAKAELEAILFK